MSGNKELMKDSVKEFLTNVPRPLFFSRRSRATKACKASRIVILLTLKISVSLFSEGILNPDFHLPAMIWSFNCSNTWIFCFFYFFQSFLSNQIKICKQFYRKYYFTH